MTPQQPQDQPAPQDYAPRCPYCGATLDYQFVLMPDLPDQEGNPTIAAAYPSCPTPPGTGAGECPRPA